MKQLIETKLCDKAEIVDIDENSMFAGLSDGTLDLVTELWPSGVVADEQAFIDDGSIVNVGASRRRRPDRLVRARLRRQGQPQPGDLGGP